MNSHYEIQYQNDYIAKLGVQGNEATEVVFFNGAMIHQATFPVSNLGSTKRGAYLECMVASVARSHKAALLYAEGDNMTYMELIREYARICNVDVQDMLNHIQRDRFAEIQFLDWLKRVGEAA